MSKVGILKEIKLGELYEGEITTLDLSLLFEIRKLSTASTNLKAPTHVILAWNKNGVEVPVGSAWMKTINKPGRDGEQFFSLTLSDPSFGWPLNVAAFKSDTENVWSIVFRHRQDKAA